MKKFRIKITRNTFRRLYFKLVKQSGSPETIARGVAIGLFIGFFIPFGLQMVIAFALAVVFRANKILAMAFTWGTNYVTIPILYPLQCYLGSVVIRAPLSFQHINQMFKKFFASCAKAEGFFEYTAVTFSALYSLGEDILIPFLIGGAILGTISGFIGYFASYGIAVDYRKRKKRKLNRKLAAAAHR